MSYQVLARKYRPRSFAELVGQEQVTRALRHALDQNRLHHAYLFTGTRGVGKTTVARILARCLNCEQGVSATPCGECSACVAISEGRFFDLIEVDAASRTGIDDTRELLDNVQYAPSMGRFKVYLIDEVHMLSISSFNALLKTLEEPPPHVKFLLATTDPQKLPITVLSRCLQFNLKMLPTELIAEHLAGLLQQEGVGFEAPALPLLGRAAAGSMRDALSLTDQAIAFGDGALTEAQVRAMLGSVDRDHVLKLLAALADGKPAGVLQAVDEVFGYHPDALSLLDDLISHCHQLAVEQIVPGRADARLAELASRFQAEQLQLYYDIAVRGRAGLAQLNDGKSGLEMLLLRMLLFRPEGVLLQAPLPEEGADAKKSRAAAAAQPQPEVSAPSNDTAESVAAAAETSVHREPEPTAPTLGEPEPPVFAASAESSVVGDSLPADADKALVAETPVHVAPDVIAPDVSTPEIMTQVAPADVELVEVIAPASVPEPDAEAVLEHEPKPESESAPGAVEAVETTAVTPPAAGTELDAWWMDLLPRLGLSGAVLNLAANSRLLQRDAGHWQLALAEGDRIWASPERSGELAAGIQAYFARAVKLDWQFQAQVDETPAQRAKRQREAREQALHRSIVEDERTRKLLAAFDGQLVPGSIKPLIEDIHHGF